MKPIDKTSEDLFQKLRSRFSPISMGNEEANETAVPSEARIFNFMYKEGDVDVGYVSISIIDNRSFKLYYGNDLEDKIENKHNWYAFLKEMRMFAKRNLMMFDARDLAKNQLEPRDFKFISTHNKTYKDNEVTVSESVMFGSRRKSYQTMENVKMIVNHRKSIDETIPGSRSRYIESIYLERADGERYKFPYNYLTGARAMASHINEGGNPYDEIGKHIIGMIKEMRDLSKFARRTKKHAMEDENAGNIRNSVVERFHSMKKQLGAMSVKEGYSRFVENFKAEETLAEDETIQQIKERFTQQVFDTQLEDTLPAVMKAIREAEIRQVSEADKSIEKLIRTMPLVLRKDSAADQMFRTTKFTDGAGLLAFILSDIASRAIGNDADVVANFASDAAERIQDKDYDPNDKQLAMTLAKKYMDDVKKMNADPSYADQVRVDSKEIYGAKKKRTGGFHESEAYEAWANDLVPEDYDSKAAADAKQGDEYLDKHAGSANHYLWSVAYKKNQKNKHKAVTGMDADQVPESNVKKKSNEAVTQGTVGTQGPVGSVNVGQAMRDPKLQQAAKNVSRMTQAAGIKAPPGQIAQGMAAQAAGKMPPRQTMQTIGGLGNTVMQAAASDPKKAAQLTAMMKKMVTQGKFDEAAVREFLEQTINEEDPTLSGDILSQAWRQGKTKPQVDKMFAPGGKPIIRQPGVGANIDKLYKDTIAKQASGAKITPPIPTAKPSNLKTNVVAPTSTTSAPIPTPKPTTASVVQKGGNVWNTFKSTFGRAPSQAELAQIAKSSGIKDINKVMPGQKLDFSKIK